METLTVSDYRNNLASSFNRADKGERILIRRKNEIYALVKIGREDLMITPELQARIDEVERECKKGKVVRLKTKEELGQYLDNL